MSPRIVYTCAPDQATCLVKREQHSVHSLRFSRPPHTLIDTLLLHLAKMVLALAIHTVSTQVSAKARHPLLNPGSAIPHERLLYS